MSTANLESKRFDGVSVNTKLVIGESNNADVNADAQTPGMGFFMKPSDVTGRTANVTGFLVTSSNESGKLEFSDPDGFLALGDLSDVTLTAPVANNLLSFDGTEWVNTGDITPDSVTFATKATVTQETSITTGVTADGSAGIITTFLPATAADASDTFTVSNASVTTTSVVVAVISDYTGASLPTVRVGNVAAGSFDIVVQNTGAAALDQPLEISFIVM